MQGFNGFPPGKTSSTRIPNLFFSDLLPLIDDIAELKLTLYCFWALHQREGSHRYVRRRDMIEDAILLRGLAPDRDEALRVLDQALERATARGTLLHIIVDKAAGEPDHLYFMNTARGRVAVEALEHGDWKPGTDDQPVALIVERPNIFALYEQNIGPLTPILSDILRDAEQTYPSDWIEHALKLAVERNIRNWRYVEGILKRWMSDGRAEGLKDGSIRADAEKDRKSAYGDYERFWDMD